MGFPDLGSSLRINLTTGREISLVTIHQSLTYYGLLAGLPHRDGNARTIQHVLDSARERGLKGLEPHLISPNITPIEPPPPSPKMLEAVLKKTGMTAEEHARFQAERHLEHLPRVACIGVFDSNGLSRSDSEPYSSMTIVWFQDNFAPPIDDNVLSQIRQLDWDALAKDWIW